MSGAADSVAPAVDVPGSEPCMPQPAHAITKPVFVRFKISDEHKHNSRLLPQRVNIHRHYRHPEVSCSELFDI